MKRTHLALGLVAAGFVAIVLVITRPHSLANANADKPFERAQKLYASGDHNAARQHFEDFIEQSKNDPDKLIQNQVTRARMSLGFMAAKKKAYAEAALAFKEAETKHKGTTLSVGDFGSMSDQAAYQAAVCLAAAKSEGADEAFRRLIKERPLSPIIYAAHKRLALLNGGATTPDDDALLQAALSKQESNRKAQLSACGPKAVAYLLKLMAKPVPDLQSLRKACGTTEKGTTMAGVRKALQGYGLSSVGLELTRKDLSKVKLPALWLREEHYVVLLKIAGNRAVAFDPLTGQTETFELPGQSAPDFLATVIALEMPVLEEVS